MFMKLSSIPVVKVPLVDVSTDPLDLLVAGLALRMKQFLTTHQFKLIMQLTENPIQKDGMNGLCMQKLMLYMEQKNF